MARKKKPEDHVNLERWMVSYADFLTLMFAFFVVMFSVSQVDNKKVGKFSESFSKALGINVFGGTDGVFDGTKAIIGQSLTDARVADTGEAFPEKLVDVEKELTVAIEKINKDQQAEQAAKKAAGSKGADGGTGAEDRAISTPKVAIKVFRKRTELVLRIQGEVLFGSGSDEIQPSGVKTVHTIGESLAKSKVLIRVEGHTDNRPIHTTMFRSNWHLSTGRATAVVRYFAEKLGIAPRFLSAAGYGEFHPVATNNTRDGRRQNRRVDIVVGIPLEARRRPKTPLKPGAEPKPDAPATTPAATGSPAATDSPATEPSTPPSTDSSVDSESTATPKSVELRNPGTDSASLPAGAH
jgi:chemotaxis protein MotB